MVIDFIAEYGDAMLMINKIEKDESSAISLIRLLAFLSIVTCHMMQYWDLWLAWWFNVGVQIFLCISGYLYSYKKHFDDINFYMKRARKILIPYYIVIIPVLFLHILLRPSETTMIEVISVLLCSGRLEGGEHLWFIPTILLCYFLTPGIKRFLDYCETGKDIRFIAGGGYAACPYFNNSYSIYPLL